MQNWKASKKTRRKKKAAADEKTEGNAPVNLVTHIITLCKQYFSIVEVYIKNKVALQKDTMRTGHTFPTTSRKRSMNSREFGPANCMTMKNVKIRLCTHVCLNSYSKTELNCSVEPMFSRCIVIWELTFFLRLKFYIETWKVDYDWSESYPWLAMVSQFHFVAYVIVPLERIPSSLLGIYEQNPLPFVWWSSQTFVLSNFTL